MELGVVSFNIRCCDDANGNSIAERAPRLGKIIHSYAPDVIGLQEYRPAWEKPIDELFAEKYEIFNKYRSEKIDIESSPILWRKDKFECVKTGYFWLSDTPEVESRGWDELYNCFRMCVYVTLREKESGKMFNFMNTHFGFGDNGQVKSAKLIYDYSKKLPSYPTFIVGDFNMKPESLGYAAMIENFTDVNVVTANDMRTTWHNYEPDKTPCEHIDYCFIDGSIKALSQKIIDDKVDDMFPSDHYGLYMKLGI